MQVAGRGAQCVYRGDGRRGAPIQMMWQAASLGRWLRMAAAVRPLWPPAAQPPRPATRAMATGAGPPAEADTVVVGSGVVGLAVARELATHGRRVLVLEAGPSIAAGGNSRRSSDVVHSGLYYRPGSLKARLCVEGRRMMYAYCEERGVAFRKTGA